MDKHVEFRKKFLTLLKNSIGFELGARSNWYLEYIDDIRHSKSSLNKQYSNIDKTKDMLCLRYLSDLRFYDCIMDRAIGHPRIYAGQTFRIDTEYGDFKGNGRFYIVSDLFEGINENLTKEQIATMNIIVKKLVVMYPTISYKAIVRCLLEYLQSEFKDKTIVEYPYTNKYSIETWTVISFVNNAYLNQYISFITLMENKFKQLQKTSHGVVRRFVDFPLYSDSKYSYIPVVCCNKNKYIELLSSVMKV